jgi:indole-3-glycerol phosphate synthase
MSETYLDAILARTRQTVRERKDQVPLERLQAGASGVARGGSGVSGDGPSGLARSGSSALEEAPSGSSAFEEARSGSSALEKGDSARVRTRARESVVVPRLLRDALRAPGMGVIAEFKRRSPSAGALAAAPDLATFVGAYERGGATALSILTDGPHFEGSLDDLASARACTDLPILRKDFIVDAYQLHEALAAGADAVLLIVAALSDRELAELHAQAIALRLDPLVEVHDQAELERALVAGADLIGVNNRDLRDFSVDVKRTERLMSQMPPAATVLSESGISSAEQLRELGELGVHGVLVGEALMRASDPERALRELAAASRSEAPEF